MLDDVDLLVCGAGPVGATIAERAAQVLGWRVLVVERRTHLAGNCHDSVHPSGLRIHNYGPHYFRTSDEKLLRYLSRFTVWIPGNYRVQSSVGGQLFPFPINLTTLERFFGKKLHAAAAARLLAQKRLPIAQPRNSEEYVLGQLGRELYESFYLGYTLKQWGRHPRELAPSVCGRVPVRLNRDDRYVEHRYQVMPKDGFTTLFTRMLRHRKIRILTDCDFREIQRLVRPRQATVYSGPIDAYFDHCFERLPYRSLQFDFVPQDVEFAQPCVQINYPNEHAWTRTVEIKHVTRQRHPHTVVCYETPQATGEPYYPVPAPAHQQLYERYRLRADRATVVDRVYFCGRLAQYRYFNTDEAILEALQCFERIRRDCAAPAPAVCLVAPIGAGLDHNLGQQTTHVAETLSAAGWRVHLLWCGDAADAPRLANCTAWQTHPLADIRCPETVALGGPLLFETLQISDRVLHAVRHLHERHAFVGIAFPERGGLGFRAIQAKQTGQAFVDVPLIAMQHGTTAAIRKERRQWLDDPIDVTLDYAEDYVVEFADGWIDIDLPTSDWLDAFAALRPARPLWHTSFVEVDSSPLVTIGVPYYNLGDFLPETLTSLAWQTYTNLEVFVINDGSTDVRAVEVYRQMQTKFPQFHFLEQANAGIGATRNRALHMARGKYFLPVDADNVADPDMVRRFVRGLECNRHISALTCYFLAFRAFADLSERQFLYACKPTGGPRVLGCLQNVYGDGNAMFRTAALRAVGGFETDRDTSFEDWEAFVKLVNAGHRVEVLPDFLFYYRHRQEGFSRVTDDFHNHQRVLRRFIEIEKLPPVDRKLLWNLLVGYHRRVADLHQQRHALKTQLGARRYRAVDRLLKIAKTVAGAWLS